MAYETFTEKLGLRAANRAKLNAALQVITTYMAQGLKLTLRQLFYQLVSRNVIRNTRSEYSNLSVIVTKGRKAGYIDWDAIEDRIRVPYRHYHVENVLGALDRAYCNYRLDRQAGQDVYIEVWVEKDALFNVLLPVTDRYHVYLLVNRGYPSTTAIYDASLRYIEADEEGKAGIIFYIGDHDPSGLDMVRDIEERMEEFGAFPHLVRIALTWEQIQEHKPPANYTKIRDPRAEWYISQYGVDCWEVDALPPEVLNKLVTEAVESKVDLSAFKKIIESEAEGRMRLLDIMKNEKRHMKRKK